MPFRSLPRAWLAALLALLVATLATGAAAEARARGGVVLLSFDTEQDPDEEVLGRLGLDRPATYFFTASYGERHPALLRRLAQEGNTIGSHSFYHDHLPTLSDKERRLDLELSRLLLEQIACTPVLWFRAPYLDTDAATLRQVIAAGYAFESSDEVGWPNDGGLPSLGVSAFEDHLVSDYNIFVADGRSDADALSFLTRAYDWYVAHGRPFVVLMHPRIIGEHPQVLRDFIAHVDATGGRFLSFQGYADSLATRPVAQQRLGLWIDLGAGLGDLDALVAAAVAGGVTDAFLSVRDPEGGSYLDLMAGGRSVFDTVTGALQAAGIRVQAWVPVATDPALARSRPDLAMVHVSGTVSDRWVSPSRPEVREAVTALALTLLRDHGVDGILLDDLRYPDWNYDFSPAAIEAFAAATGVAESDPQKILNLDYARWVRWRMGEIAGLVEGVEAALRAQAGRPFEFSASVVAEAAVDYRAMEATGQDYTLLGEHLDFAVPTLRRTGAEDEAPPPDWSEILFSARTRLGNRPILAGFDLPATGGVPEGPAPGAREFALADGAVLRPDAAALAAPAAGAGFMADGLALLGGGGPTPGWAFGGSVADPYGIEGRPRQPCRPLP